MKAQTCGCPIGEDSDFMLSSHILLYCSDLTKICNEVTHLEYHQAETELEIISVRGFSTTV